MEILYKASILPIEIVRDCIIPYFHIKDCIKSNDFYSFKILCENWDKNEKSYHSKYMKSAIQYAVKLERIYFVKYLHNKYRKSKSKLFEGIINSAAKYGSLQSFKYFQKVVKNINYDKALQCATKKGRLPMIEYICKFTEKRNHSFNIAIVMENLEAIKLIYDERYITEINILTDSVIYNKFENLKCLYEIGCREYRDLSVAIWNSLVGSKHSKRFLDYLLKETVNDEKLHINIMIELMNKNLHKAFCRLYKFKIGKEHPYRSLIFECCLKRSDFSALREIGKVINSSNIDRSTINSVLNSKEDITIILDWFYRTFDKNKLKGILPCLAKNRKLEYILHVVNLYKNKLSIDEIDLCVKELSNYLEKEIFNSISTFMYSLFKKTHYYL
jgi:hypothetical protein